MLVFDRVLKDLVKHGTFEVTEDNGTTRRYGNGQPPVSGIRFTDRHAPMRLLLNPEFELPDQYMSGAYVLEKGDVYDLLDVLLRNARAHRGVGPFGRLAALARKGVRRMAQFNPAIRSKRNVAHHYDLSDDLYDLFLDADRQYSCAYFPSPDATLETAQAWKKRHLAAKLLLQPGLKVLDIGSGWGGLGLYLAGASGADVTGITLSEEQLRVSNERARASADPERVRFELRDYRHETRRYDRVVSVGMLEHVGVNHFDAYFRQVARMLTEDGVALIHSIGRSDGPGATNPWIAKYIFPGGYAPALSEVLPAIERAGLIVTDIEVLRLHYAETLRAWRERFNLNRERIRALYDERFCRMWEMYLASSEATFRYGGHMNFQIQVSKSLTAVPLTRDYIDEAERILPLDLATPRPARRRAQAVA